jgi:hypothetical protein
VIGVHKLLVLKRRIFRRSAIKTSMSLGHQKPNHGFKGKHLYLDMGLIEIAIL